MPLRALADEDIEITTPCSTTTPSTISRADEVTHWVILRLLVSACAQAESRTVAIRAATLVDVTDGSLRPDHTVLIVGHRCCRAGQHDQGPRPRGRARFGRRPSDPGLWDTHVHSVANIALDMRVTSVAAMDWHFPLFLAWGVTAVRNMNDGTGDVRLRLTNSVKRRLKTRELSGPRLLANGPSIDGDPALGSNSAIVRTAAEARAAVDTLAASGADFIKVYENLTREAYLALMDEARRKEIPVDGHVPFRVTPAEAAAAGLARRNRGSPRDRSWRCRSRRAPDRR